MMVLPSPPPPLPLLLLLLVGVVVAQNAAPPTFCLPGQAVGTGTPPCVAAPPLCGPGQSPLTTNPPCVFCLPGYPKGQNGCSNLGWCSWQPLPSAPTTVLPLCNCPNAFVAPQCQASLFAPDHQDAVAPLSWTIAALSLCICLLAVLVCVEHVVATRNDRSRATPYQRQQFAGAIVSAAAGLTYALFWSVNPLGFRFGYPNMSSLIGANGLLFLNLALLSTMGGIAVGAYVGVAWAVKVLRPNPEVSSAPTLVVACSSGGFVAVLSVAALVYTAVTPEFDPFIYFNVPFVGMFCAVTLQFVLSLVCSFFIFCSARSSQKAAKASARQQQMRRFAMRTAVVSAIELVAAMCLLLVVFRPSSSFGYFLGVDIVVVTLGQFFFLLASTWLFRIRPAQSAVNTQDTADALTTQLNEPLIQESTATATEDQL